MGLFNALRRGSCWVLAMLLPTGVASADPLLSGKNDFFPIGVWQQPTTSFGKWKNRGINMLMEAPIGHDLTAWSDAAMNSDMLMIRRPDNGTKPGDASAVAASRRADLNKYRSHLLAWTMPDEPDFKELSWRDLLDDYRAMKAVDPKRPPTVLMNFSGGTVLGLGTRDGTRLPYSDYQYYSKAADWISNDFYPVTGWGRADWIDYSKPMTGRKTEGMAIDKLREMSRNKPQLAVLETSDQNLPWVPGDHGVNADQFRGQLWQAIIRGAQGIAYFPLQLGSRFSFDGTPAAVAEEMTIQHERIQRLAKVINAPRNPDALGFVAGNKAAAQLLEVSWRRTKGADYFFVLNMSSESATLPFALTGVEGTAVIHGENRWLRANEGGIFKDQFDAWEIHVYKFAPPVAAMRAMSSVAVPEPGSLFAGLALAVVMLRRVRTGGRA